MGSRNAQKRKTAKRKARQQKAWKLYKAASAQNRDRWPADLRSVPFSQLREPTKHAIAALLNAVERR